MKRFLIVLMAICTCLAFTTVAYASCMSAWLDIWDATNPLQGYDSATAYLKANTCNSGTHNTLCVRATLTNSDGSTVTKTSAAYTNATGTKNSGEAKAKNRDAKKAVGYAKAKCSICGQNYGNGTTFKAIRTHTF